MWLRIAFTKTDLTDYCACGKSVYSEGIRKNSVKIFQSAQLENICAENY
jgi:hypothetical protein